MSRTCKEITADQIFELIGDAIDLDPTGCHVLTPTPSDDSSEFVTCFLLAKLINSVTPSELFLNIPRALFDRLIDVDVEQVLGESR